MIIFVALLALALISSTLSLGEWSTQLAQPVHQACLQFAPDSPWRDAYSALVCGASLPVNDLYHALQKTSLLHLAVVSGSHLILIESMLRKAMARSPLLEKLVFCFLVLYSMASGWQPPAVRALAGLLIHGLQKKMRWGWTPLQVTFFSGFALWSLYPYWAQSYSFLLSWGASLGLALTPTKDRHFIEQWRTHLIVFVVLVPVLAPLSTPHPLTVLCNWLLGPLLGLVLFPMSLACFLIPPLTAIGDSGWLATATAIKFVSHWIPDFNLRGHGDPLWLWAYIFSLHFIGEILHRHTRRIQWHDSNK